MYTRTIRPLLFRLKPEQAHDFTLQALRIAGAIRLLNWFIRRLLAADQGNGPVVDAFGLTFPNPVGLAAGYDKDGLSWRGLAALGFGHIEIGTVTPRPQAGNPKPRVFRIPAEEAVINRMGFPGRGSQFVANRLGSRYSRPDTLILGVNIGKNKDTPNQEAAQDYLYLLDKFTPLADYLAVNVSSPNTVGLRRLQARENLEDLLHKLNAARAMMRVQKPILVKLAPDLDDAELDDALEAIVRTEMDGVIATNTTISRKNLKSPLGRETGGLSGAPLTGKSLQMVSAIHQRTEGKLPIIGVGGIMSPQNAKAMLDAGATLVQVYSGLIYTGPGLVKAILSAL